MIKIIERLVSGENLKESQMTYAMTEIMEGRVSSVHMASFLTALRLKGETSEEISGGAKVMRDKAEQIDLGDRYTVDTCGTGGDGTDTYNISTASAFVTAAGGVAVVKHGNRSVSSQCGSADVLETLGINIGINSKRVKECVEKIDLGFLYAPAFHSSMKYAAAVRKELGFRTIFNMLGPLTNPARANGQVLGVFHENLTGLMAEAMKKLGTEHVLVVHGMDGMDEITVTDRTKVSELKGGKINSYYIEPEDFGMKRRFKEELEGGTPKENAEIIRGIFKGEIREAKKDILLLNSGAALYAGKKASSIQEGVEMAREIIESGKALAKLDELVEMTNR
ncbi:MULTISPECIES: anthranilate phosphoribosyltransferase [Psychrilyobacter]|uniref:Anthranilate phosphoribosyltransferase n=1 Tax=Psychrilyobacter piezotolerans TaxID=2293438 RepID=A0ABX9KKW9_9FUSO|nr:MULTISPECIES: anthranilate phosphoribosyltransferase [Psychrilyobacter]MCS5420992.1 anthranilate phosphoribosyltransferase [Psychrilyobacter sp. S5]NDI76724.1 anthranilate phosphoribosyltransferase [Psychrilyobacter piezotolerans]RDE65345.1 anthranilate phosphoribosyltransferase [Psychrilyobacter sp. S5]REI42963.1 anthranilate phosphoribosyltransferase [Psychrilyobacter piezotolerans]